MVNTTKIYASPPNRNSVENPEYGITGLPFIWHHVDAYLLHPDLGRLRSAFGDREEAFSADDWSAEPALAIETAKENVRTSL